MPAFGVSNSQPQALRRFCGALSTAAFAALDGMSGPGVARSHDPVACRQASVRGCNRTTRPLFRGMTSPVHPFNQFPNLDEEDDATAYVEWLCRKTGKSIGYCARGVGVRSAAPPRILDSTRWDLRSAIRIGLSAGDWDNVAGFRIARTFFTFCWGCQGTEPPWRIPPTHAPTPSLP